MAAMAAAASLLARASNALGKAAACGSMVGCAAGKGGRWAPAGGRAMGALAEAAEKFRPGALKDKTVVVAGGTATTTVGRGIVAQLLAAEATVVAHSRSPVQLEELKRALGQPERLKTMPIGFAGSGFMDENQAQTIASAIAEEVGPIHGVVAHGGIMRSSTLGHADDLTGKSVLDVSPQLMMDDVAALVGLHVRAAQALLPLLEKGPSETPTYTFVTGAASPKTRHEVGADGPARTAMHGLGLALRNAAKTTRVHINEVRCAIRLQPTEKLGADIGLLASYLAEGTSGGSPNAERLDAETCAALHDHLQRFQ